MNVEYLKVKAKRKNNGEWIKGYYVYFPKIDGFSEEKHYISKFMYGKIYYEEIDPETICRHWFDDFYENDIIEQIHKGILGTKYIIRYGLTNKMWINGEYDFNYYGFYLETVDGEKGFEHKIENIEYFFDFKDEFKVIGNIYDNPELLKEE